MSSGYGSLPRPRYSRARRAAIVAACASVLTGTAMVMPAATFADEAADTPPIATLDLGGATVDVPALGVPLPDLEVDTDQLPIASVTDALGLAAAVDLAPEPADTEPTTTEPSSGDPTTTEPGAERGWAEPNSDASSDDEVRTMSDPTSVERMSDVPSDRVSSGRSTPASAVAAPAPGSRLTTASPVASQQVVTGVIEARTQRQIEQRAAVRAAQVLGTEKSAPVGTASKDGFGLAAPLTDLGSRGGVDTLNLASRNGPNSASGDWNLLPEALYAVIPLMLAGAAVVAHDRRNARIAGTSVGVVQRRRHATK